MRPLGLDQVVVVDRLRAAETRPSPRTSGAERRVLAAQVAPEGVLLEQPLEKEEQVFVRLARARGVSGPDAAARRASSRASSRAAAEISGDLPAEQNRKLLTPERTQSIMNHTPMNRFGEACELVGATVFLASDQASSFVTGSIVRVDGGYTCMTI